MQWEPWEGDSPLLLRQWSPGLLVRLTFTHAAGAMTRTLQGGWEHSKGRVAQVRSSVSAQPTRRQAHIKAAPSRGLILTAECGSELDTDGLIPPGWCYLVLWHRDKLAKGSRCGVHT